AHAPRACVLGGARTRGPGTRAPRALSPPPPGPATKAYPRGAPVPRERNTPEILADRDSAKISGPRPVGVARTAAATASTSTAALIPAASQARAGRWGEDSPAGTGRAPTPPKGGWRPAT